MILLKIWKLYWNFGAFSIFALFHNSCFCQKLTTIILSKDEILVKKDANFFELEDRMTSMGSNFDFLCDP